MKKEKLCQPESYSVLIPYKDLEKLVNIAEKYAEKEKQVEALDKKVTALHGLYQEVLEALNKVYAFL